MMRVIILFVIKKVAGNSIMNREGANMMLVLKAFKYGELKHKGQVRKVSNEPYFSHPVKVSYLLASFKKSKKLEELLCVCLLHDTVEDTDATFEEIAREFTPLIASLVMELTSDREEIKKIGKVAYLKKKMVGMSSYALTLKLVDRLANMLDNPTEKSKVETKEILDHLVANRKVNSTQQRIIDEILKII